MSLSITERKVVPVGQLHVVHADLGAVEWAGALDHIRETTDVDVHVARAVHADGSAKDFFSAVRARRASLDAKGRHDAPAFPSSAARFCTSDLKTGPIWKVIRDQGHELVVNCVGIRAAESPSRSRRVEQRGALNINQKNTNSRREAYDLWPIADWSDEDVWTEIAESGHNAHPAYAAGNERMSCVFCIFGSRNDLRNGALQRPELLEAYEQLERDVRGTMFNGEGIRERLGQFRGIAVEVTA